MDIEQDIKAAGADVAPRVTPADIEANIAAEHYFGAGTAVAAMGGPEHESLNLLTICVLVLRNGFTVLGKSACASPENFNVEIGRKIARQDAVNQVWPLMGYALREKLAGQQAAAGADGLPPHQARVKVEERELADKVQKLGAFFQSPKFTELDAAERSRLSDQHSHMVGYLAVLRERIAAF